MALRMVHSMQKKGVYLAREEMMAPKICTGG
jgi:hypothetical protein